MRMVAVQHELDVRFDPFQHGDTCFYGVFLIWMEVSIRQGIGGLERSPDHFKVFFVHEGRTTAQIVFVEPGDVCSPFHFSMDKSFFRQVERDDAVCRGLRLQIAA